MFQINQTQPIQPPQGFVPRFSVQNPYSGGGPNPYTMDNLTKKLFFAKLKKSKPAPENRINFIKRNKERIMQLQTLIKSQDLIRVKSKKIERLSSPPQPLSSIFQESDQEEVQELIKFGLGEQKNEQVNSIESSYYQENGQVEVNSELDNFQQELINELRTERQKTDEKLHQNEQLKNEYIDKQKIFTMEQAEAQQQNIQSNVTLSNQNNLFNILEFTNSMAKTKQVLNQEYVNLDQIEDIPKKILQAVKDRQLQFKKDSPFLQPYLFRGRF
ncbi:hypothetical protein SS50377_20063 [Spironucleus salmonicida]|uniref:Uncharacterized protein n=1 Tax=Spironucleus salmonicida TaxID=348837 RepID=V6LYN1_9EUKA|nr:hypothetical protein SS50377_20063 [Spironucleus salmonicida]|eukprot:EST49368.1 Hypothetical protein SS50377_10293 [Spironucleus salmonicida]